MPLYNVGAMTAKEGERETAKQLSAAVPRDNPEGGRSPQNTVVLDSPKVSRRHAIINVQNVGEFWLIDLGSSNGTFLNKRRIHQPLRLSDYDQFAIGDSIFTFRQAEQIADAVRTITLKVDVRRARDRDAASGRRTMAPFGLGLGTSH